MAWDANAVSMAANTIALVEGAGAYDAINLNDPITLGLMQWYGPRAADLLTRIKADHPTQYATISSRVRDKHASTPDNSSLWRAFKLTLADAKTIRPVLRASHDTQNALVASDMEDYKQVAINLGMDTDRNTMGVQFFCVMYHQSPKQASRVLSAVGPASSIDRLYAGAMNNPVLSDYKTRYTKARDTIKSGAIPPLIDLNDDDMPGSDGTGDGGAGGIGSDSSESGGQRPSGNIEYVTAQGDVIYIKLKGAGLMEAVPTGGQYYEVSAAQPGTGVDIPDEDVSDNEGGSNTDPDPGAGGGEVGSKRRTVVARGKSVMNTWVYTNDARRDAPDKNKAGDCSAFTRWCYAAVGIKLGYNTAAQYTQGKRIASSANPNGWSWSDLELGDLVYIQWKNPAYNSGKVTDHVEMYAGNGQFIGMPNTPGPRLTPVSTYVPLFRKWWVQRHLG